MLEKLDNAELSKDDIDLDDKDSDVVTIPSRDMGLNTINLNNINLDNDNFDNDGPETIIHLRRMAWCNRHKQHKTFKKKISKALMLAACHPIRWWGLVHVTR